LRKDDSGNRERIFDGRDDLQATTAVCAMFKIEGVNEQAFSICACVRTIRKSLKVAGCELQFSGVAAKHAEQRLAQQGNRYLVGSLHCICCFDWKLPILIRYWTFTCGSEKLSGIVKAPHI